jgi:hypothetical protein
MNDTIPKDFRESLEKIMAAGDEAKAREFIIENLKLLPQKVQDSIITALVEEALEKKNNEDQDISNVRKEVMRAFSETGDAVDELEKHAKLKEIKESL